MARPKREAIAESELLYERFYNARTQFNQHGFQNTVAVGKGCGVTHSLIEDAEKDINPPRAIDYLTVKKLAEYYGVCSDYLLGLDDKPTKDTNSRAIQDCLGLSEKAIKKLRELKADPGKGSFIAILNNILEDGKLYGALSQLAAAKKEIAESHVIDTVGTAKRTVDKYGFPIREVDAAVYVQMLELEAERQLTEMIRGIINREIEYQQAIDGGQA